MYHTTTPLGHSWPNGAVDWSWALWHVSSREVAGCAERLLRPVRSGVVDRRRDSSRGFRSGAWVFLCADSRACANAGV